MSDLFGWVGALVRWLADWIPRPAHIDVAEAAVLFDRGKPARAVPRGLVWYVPAWQRLEAYSVLQSAYEFRPCVLTTKDGHSVAIGFSLVWSIEDMLAACTTCDSFHAIIKEMGESILPSVVAEHTWDELIAALNREGRRWDLNRQLTQAATTLLKPYGLRVHGARVNNLAKSRVMRLIQNDVA